MRQLFRDAEILSYIKYRIETCGAGILRLPLRQGGSMGKTEGNAKKLSGVVCDVRNCAYHDGEDCCTAKRIAVGPSFAVTSGETVCATFKPRSL